MLYMVRCIRENMMFDHVLYVAKNTNFFIYNFLFFFAVYWKWKDTFKRNEYICVHSTLSMSMMCVFVSRINFISVITLYNKTSFFMLLLPPLIKYINFVSQWEKGYSTVWGHYTQNIMMFPANCESEKMFDENLPFFALTALTELWYFHCSDSPNAEQI